MNFYQKMPEILKNSIFPILAFAGAGNGSWLRGNSASQWVFREYITKSPKIQGFPPQNPRISSQIHTWVGLGTASVWFPSPSWPSLFSPKANTEPLSAGTTGIQQEFNNRRKNSILGQMSQNSGAKGADLGEKGWIFGEKAWMLGQFSQIFGKKEWNLGEKGQILGQFSQNLGAKGADLGKKGWILKKKGMDLGIVFPEFGAERGRFWAKWADFKGKGLDFGEKGRILGQFSQIFGEKMGWIWGQKGRI